MRYVCRLMPRRLGAVAFLAAVLGGIGGFPVAANAQTIATGWLFILEFPTGNVNAQVTMTSQGGQLAGRARIARKLCFFTVSGTFAGDEDSGGTFAMTWTGQRACVGEVLTLRGTVVNEEITGTFTDTIVSGGPFGFTGTVVSGDQD